MLLLPLLSSGQLSVGFGLISPLLLCQLVLGGVQEGEGRHIFKSVALSSF